MKHDLIIARYGELALKSDGVRKRFENRLANNIRASIDAEVKVRQARIYISPKDDKQEYIFLQRILMMQLKSLREYLVLYLTLQLLQQNPLLRI